MFCALLGKRYQVSVHRTNGPLVLKLYTRVDTVALQMSQFHQITTELCPLI